MLYLYIKAFHLIAIVVWFAGLFYLPRLFVYHIASDNKQVKEHFVVMEKRLYKIIMNNALVAVFILGLALLWINPELTNRGWFHLKLLLVFGLLVYHIMCGRYMRSLAIGRCDKSALFFRWFNEIPTVFLIIIIILAVTKPF